MLFRSAGAVAEDGEVDGGQAAKVRVAQKNVNAWMGELKTKGRVTVPKLAVEAARRDMIAERASDEQVRFRPSFRVAREAD